MNFEVPQFGVALTGECTLFAMVGLPRYKREDVVLGRRSMVGCFVLISFWEVAKFLRGVLVWYAVWCPEGVTYLIDE